MFSRSYQHFFQELFPAIHSQSLPPKAVGKGFPLQMRGIDQIPISRKHKLREVIRAKEWTTKLKNC